MSREYLVAFSIGAMPQGQIYSAGTSLPLHCTMMHWFRLSPELPLEDLETKLAELAKNASGPLELITHEHRLFGPHNDVPVWTLKRPEEELLMHTRLLVFLARHNSLPSELRWVGAGWNPHVSVVNGKPARSHTRMTARQVVLIERGDNNSKVVQSVFVLG